MFLWAGNSHGVMPIEDISFITNLTPLAHRAPVCGLLVECAADHAALDPDIIYVPITTLLGDLTKTKQQAHALAQKLIAGEPEIEGLPQLAIFEEFVIAELVRLLQTAHLDAWMCVQGVRVCRFAEYSQWVADLRALQQANGSRYRIESPTAQRVGILNKIREHTKDFGWSSGGIKVAIGRLWRRSFPCLSRVISEDKVADSDLPKGGWWFYTTGYNFTRIGLMYEPYLTQPMRYMVEDWKTGGRALLERGKTGYSIYSLARYKDVPSTRTVCGAAAKLTDHLRSVSLEESDSRIRKRFIESGWFPFACRRLLPLAILYTRVLERWIETVRPNVMIFGNAVFEGYLIHKARKRGIPTVLLQHGILGDYYQVATYPMDHLIVRGRFYCDFISEENKKKSIILNPPEPVIDSSGPRDCILFLTGYNLHEYWTHPENIAEILKTLVRSAHRLGRRLIVRVHPAESVRRYSQIVEKLLRSENLHAEVEYSQGGTLDSLMARSKVAVLFYSTVLLDCLRYGVPIISFAWSDYSIRRCLDEAKVVQMARDYADLADWVSASMEEGLDMSREILDYFLEPTSEMLMRDTFASIRTDAAAVR